ncbi:MAG: hypothetical protein ACT4PJ_12285 [Gemmatimonadaceae bacterium]
MIGRVALALLLYVSVGGAQERAIGYGPTVAAARAGFFVAPEPSPTPAIDVPTASPCGSVMRNALLMGLGFALATGSLELLYTLVREPFVRSGHDVPRANPEWIAWAGGAGFMLGLVSTAICQRRDR